MASSRKTVIVTGASQGIGAAVVKAFLQRDYYVVGTARDATKSTELKASDKLVLVDGDIGHATTARKVADAAVQSFGSIDALVNNAGIFIAKPFIDYTADDLRVLVSVNIEGYIHITQIAVKQMLAQKSGGSVVAITAALVQNPIYGVPASVSMITKGGLDAITLSLASEYAKEHIRFNAVAPGSLTLPFIKTASRSFSRPYLQWAPSPLPKRSQARWSISPNRARSQGRCRTWTAVRTTANGSPGESAACQRGTTAAGPRHRAPQSASSARRIRRGSPVRQSALPQWNPANQKRQTSIHRTSRQRTRCRSRSRCPADRNPECSGHREGASGIS